MFSKLSSFSGWVRIFPTYILWDNIYNEKIEEQIRTLQQDNEILKKIVEENQSQTVVLDIIKGEAIKMNEGLGDTQKKLFYTLKKIQKDKSNQMKLSL